jgi:hypothetical protein
MKLTSEEMRSLYQRQTARSVAGRDDCLLEDVMTRAAAGELSRSERGMIADHLAICSDCAQEYRILRQLKPSVTTQLGWPRRLIGGFSTGPAAYAFAAALLVVSLACAVWVITLRRENARMTARLEEQLSNRDQISQSLAETRRQLEEVMRRAEEQRKEITEMRRSLDDLSQPQVNVPFADLELQDVRGGAGGGVSTVRAPAGANLFLLFLHVAGGPTFSDYALEISDAQGRRVWRARGLRRSQEDTFTVSLQRRLFPAGQYRLSLYGLRAGRSESVGVYTLRVRYH